MELKIPVECQNGHKAFWHIKINGLNIETLGVPTKDKCDCPKWDYGQGYHALGNPEVVEDNQEDSNAI